MERLKTEVYHSFVQEDGSGGNPAGVALHNGITREQMQHVARQLNLSETAFLEHITDGTKRGCYQALFYTPNGSQVALCGHATIAAGMHVLTGTKHEGLGQYTQRYELEKKWEETTVKKDGDLVMYKQYIPHGSRGLRYEQLLDILGVDAGDVDYNFQPTSIHTDGLLALTPQAFDALPSELNFKDLARWLEHEDQGLEGVHVFTMEDHDDLIARCRNFAPAVGINEESATGSVTGLLAFELRRQQCIEPDRLMQTMRFVQGEAHESPHSELFVRFEGEDVWVGGRALHKETQKIDL